MSGWCKIMIPSVDEQLYERIDSLTHQIDRLEKRVYSLESEKGGRD